MTPTPAPPKEIPSQLVLHRPSNRLMTVVQKQGRITWCCWFVGEKLERGPFWAHHLDFDVERIRARAKELGLDKPHSERPPDPGAGNV